MLQHSPDVTTASAPLADTFELDRQDILQALRRFQQANKVRLDLVRNSLVGKQQDFLELLPLLLHFNHVHLPGQLDDDTPHGLWGYTNDAKLLRKVAKLGFGLTTKQRPPSTIDIDAIYLMGSSGTIAQSRMSDFDIWLCHRENLDVAGLAKLKGKADALSRWSEQIGLEVHFFLLSAQHFRDQGAESLSSESSGSSQHHLLLDEFYRTSILVAGRPPLWWLVPPDHELNYAKCRKELLRNRYVTTQDYLDFGPVADIEPSEFFGATLWQLFKAVSAPYKSLLKILLLEAYAADHPTIDLVCMRYKRAVYAGETDHSALDPYILLLKKIEDHLEHLGDTERLSLARRCLYFKVNFALSRVVARSADWRSRCLQKMADQWGWTHEQLVDLDARHGWKIDRILTEHKVLVTALTHCYKSLSLFAREHAAQSMISERDVTVLGRKLFAVFEHKAGKIGIVSRGISRDVTERRLTIQAGRSSQNENLWSLCRTGTSDQSRTILKRCWSLLELLAWGHFNGLFSSTTAVSLDTATQHLTDVQIRSITEHLRQHFNPAFAHSASVAKLAKPPHLLAASTFINLDVSPDGGNRNLARDITTRRVDPLRYSNWQQNLVYSIDYLVLTSWGECLTFHYEGIDGLLACLCEHLRWLPKNDGDVVSANHGVACCVPDDSWSVAKRVENLFEHVVSWCTTRRQPNCQRFILRAGDKYYGLLAENGVLQHEFSGSYRELLQLLSRPTNTFTSVEFDQFALDNDLLATLYAVNQQGSVQFFYQPQGKQALVYVLDETGALFRDEIAFHTEDALVNHFSLFFSSVNYRQNSASQIDTPAYWFQAPAAEARSQNVDFYRIEAPQGRKGEVGKHEFVRIGFGVKQHGLGYFDLQVIGELVNGETRFSMYCSDQEFSSHEYGIKVFEQVTQHVLTKREGHKAYPIYITDLDLSRLPMNHLNDGPLHTIHYLIYKKRIEHKLNQAIEKHCTNAATR